jgi:hypothetical protein
MGKFPNRCSGCEHFNGFYKKLVNCAKGVKANIEVGCPSFTPDNTASCFSCWYNADLPRGFSLRCVKRNIHYNDAVAYCSDYACNFE